MSHLRRSGAIPPGSISILSKLIVALLLGAVPLSGSEGLYYYRYLELNGAEKEKLISRHVRRDRDGYYRVSLSRYVARTRISPEPALRLACLMEDFHRKFSAIFKGEFRRDRRPQVYLFRDRDSYREFIRRRGVDPAFSTGMYLARGSILAAHLKGDGELPISILYHEGTHQLIHAYLGGRIPVWLNEGMAANFETWDTRYTALENIRRSAAVSHGRRRAAVEAFGEGRAIPLIRLLSMTQREWRDAEDPALNYAMAWSLVNLILNSERGRNNLNLIIHRLLEGKDPRRLLSPGAIRELETLWHEDMESRMALHEKFIGPALREAKKENLEGAIRLAREGVAASPVSMEARFWLGWILCKAGRYGDAIPDLERALEFDSNFPGILSALGKSCLRRGERARAARYLERAVQQNPADPESPGLLDEIERAGRNN